MNITHQIRRTIVALGFIACAMMSGTVTAAESGGERYIVILKSRKGPVPDLAKLGGAVTFRQDDQVIVTMPLAAVAALRSDPLVRYIQPLAGGAPLNAGLIGDPEEPLPGTPRRLVPHADAGSLSWSRQYTYDDAGNIINIDNAADTTTSQEFVYDTLGRLSEMATAGNATPTESYVYDRYGNQTSRTTSGVTRTMPVTDTTNRLATSTGYTYDAAGNVIGGDSYTFSYDALGQTAAKTYTATGSIVFSETYIYTAGDERIGVQTSVSDNSSGNWWNWSVRDEGGKVLRQYRSSSTDVTQPALWIEDYVYRDGQLAGAEHPGVLGGRRHFHLDHLGTPRLITTNAGQLVAFHDYLPFGGETTSVSNETVAGFDREDPMKFTGHERDYSGSFGREVGGGVPIDYMHARYYNGGVGRFLSVDRHEGDPGQPQTLNRYAYADNNPVRKVDLDGFQAVVPAPVAGPNVLLAVAINHAQQMRSNPAYRDSAVNSVREAVNTWKAMAGITLGLMEMASRPFLVTPLGVILPGGKDVNLVPTTAGTGKWLQIHDSHPHDGVQPHTHEPETHVGPKGENVRRTDRPTTADDIDKADQKVKDGELRPRKNRGDKGDPKSDPDPQPDPKSDPQPPE